jgi:hypothetical protein
MLEAEDDCGFATAMLYRIHGRHAAQHWLRKRRGRNLHCRFALGVERAQQSRENLARNSLAATCQEKKGRVPSRKSKTNTKNLERSRL